MLGQKLNNKNSEKKSNFQLIFDGPVGATESRGAKQKKIFGERKESEPPPESSSAPGRHFIKKTHTEKKDDEEECSVKAAAVAPRTAPQEKKRKKKRTEKKYIVGRHTHTQKKKTPSKFLIEWCRPLKRRHY